MTKYREELVGFLGIEGKEKAVKYLLQDIITYNDDLTLQQIKNELQSIALEEDYEGDEAYIRFCEDDLHSTFDMLSDSYEDEIFNCLYDVLRDSGDEVEFDYWYDQNFY